MAFKLSAEAQHRINEHRMWAEERKAVFAALDDDNLIATTKLYMSNMTPLNVAPGEPVYDATMWHIILPELLRRVSRKSL